MKKKYLPLYLILFIIFVLALFVIFNQIDSAPPANISKDDLLLAGLDKANGFYLLWTLCEPANVDIASEVIISKYREQTFDYDVYRKLYKQWGRGIAQTRVTSPNIRDLWQLVKKNRPALSEQKKKLAFLLDRYQRLITSERVEDFTYIQKKILEPDYQAFYNIGKFYTAAKSLAALEGKWQEPLDACLQQVEFCKKLIRSSRTLTANRTAKAMIQFVLRSLVSLANIPKSPPWVAEIISKHLEPLMPDHFGSYNALTCEYLFFEVWMESFKGHFRTHTSKEIPQFMLWFFQENRTKSYYADFLVKVRQQEESQPYQWLEPIPSVDPKENSWWWLQNMSGKILFDILFFPDFNFHVNDSYTTLALYRLTRLAMELKPGKRNSKSMADRLIGLKSYSLIDPFSGKPFRWKLNGDHLILYSIGTNLKDDGGVDTVNQPELDIAVTLTK